MAWDQEGVKWAVTLKTLLVLERATKYLSISCHPHTPKEDWREKKKYISTAIKSKYEGRKLKQKSPPCLFFFICFLCWLQPIAYLSHISSFEYRSKTFPQKFSPLLKTRIFVIIFSRIFFVVDFYGFQKICVHKKAEKSIVKQDICK